MSLLILAELLCDWVSDCIEESVSKPPDELVLLSKLSWGSFLLRLLFWSLEDLFELESSLCSSIACIFVLNTFYSSRSYYGVMPSVLARFFSFSDTSWFYTSLLSAFAFLLFLVSTSLFFRIDCRLMREIGVCFRFGTFAFVIFSQPANGTAFDDVGVSCFCFFYFFGFSSSDCWELSDSEDSYSNSSSSYTVFSSSDLRDLKLGERY